MTIERPHQLIDVLVHEWLEGLEGDFLFFCESKKCFAGFPVVQHHSFGLLPAKGRAWSSERYAQGTMHAVHCAKGDPYSRRGCRSIQELIGQI